ncbi:MAG: DMT family transporter [Acidimicrobiaceae bacterium]|nr:DMT family transporter [Acidimicrobiaceae bacterium]MCY4279777.1 DMT family transporter [Acidimicrobiaceae bacterium]
MTSGSELRGGGDWHTAGLLAVGTAVACWAGGNVLARPADLEAAQLAFWRLVLSTLIYSAVMASRKRRVSWPQLRACLPSAVMLGLWYVAFYEAIKSTTVTNVAMIVSLVPVVLIWPAMRRFGEPVSLKLLALVAAALAGTALVLFGSASVPTWSRRGDALAVVAMLFFAGQMAFAKEARRRIGAFEFQAVAWGVALVVTTPPALLTGGGLSFPDAEAWLWVASLVAVPGSGHLLMTWAHKHVRITVSSMALLGAPPLTMVLAAIFLDEPIRAAQVIGGVIVIAAVAGVVRRDLQITARHGRVSA